MTRFALSFAIGAPLLVFSARQAAMYSLPKLLFLSAACCAAWAGLWLESLRRRVPRGTLLDAPLLTLGAVLLLSAAFSSDGWLSLVGHYRAYFYGLLPLGLCAGLYCACALSRESRSPGLLLGVLSAAGALCGFYGVLQGADLEPFIGIGRLPEGGRIVSSMGSPVYLGACLVLNIPVALHLALDRGGFPRALGACALLSCGAALLLTLSRGAWLSCAAGVFAYLVLAGRVRFPARGARAWAVGAAGALLLLGAVFLAAGRFRRHSVSDAARLHLWHSGLLISLHHPLLGTGPDAFENALRRERTPGLLRTLGPSQVQASAHNDLLQAAATLGLPGLAAYLWLLCALAASCARALKGPLRPEAAAISGSLLGLFLQAKLNPVPLAALAAAAALAGLVEGAGASEKDGPASPPPGPLGSWEAAAAASVLLLAALGVGRLCLADYHQKRALVLSSAGEEASAADSWRLAIRLNPFETNYRMSYARFLFAKADRTEDARARGGMLAEAVALGREAVRRRPGDIDALQTLGSSLINAGRRGTRSRWRKRTGSWRGLRRWIRISRPSFRTGYSSRGCAEMPPRRASSPIV